MKVKIKISITILCLMLLLSCGFAFRVGLVKSDFNINEYANSYLMNSIQDVKNRKTSQTFKDIEDGFNGSCNVEERYLQSLESDIQPLNASVSNHKTCNSISSSHGGGRECGFQDGFLNSGCGNYSGYSFTYGSTDIPYFIDSSTMTSATANNVRRQLAIWNSIVMHDGTGQFVNLYEVAKTDDINGRKVIIISQEVLDPGTAGCFSFGNNKLTVQLSASMNVDTPLHEFGHVLGLYDLDSAASITKGTHKVLMGYNRGTTSWIVPRLSLKVRIKY